MQRIHDQDGFGFMQGPEEKVVVTGRFHPTEGSLCLVETAGETAALLEAVGTHVAVRQLVTAALPEGAAAIGQQAQVVKRANALHRLEAEDVRIAADGFGKYRLDVPGVGYDDVVGVKTVHRLARARP